MPTYRRSLSAMAFGLTAIAALAALSLVWLDVPAFRALTGWYYALPQTNYVELVQIAEFRTNIKVSSFSAHMLIMLGQIVVCALLIGWLVCWWQPARTRASARIAGGPETIAAVGLSTLTGGTILSYSLACFVSLPGTAAVCSLYAKEGVIDASHFVGFLATAALLWVAAFRLSRSTAGSGLPALGAALIGTGAFVLGMEEISWGQTYLAWQSPELFMMYNDQQETNAHNFLNGYLTPIYYAMGVAMLLGTVAAFILDDLHGHRLPWLRLLCPPRILVWLLIWLPVASEIFIFSSSECFESLMVIYALTYAVTILMRSTSLARAAAPERWLATYG